MPTKQGIMVQISYNQLLDKLGIVLDENVYVEVYPCFQNDSLIIKFKSLDKEIKTIHAGSKRIVLEELLEGQDYPVVYV